MSSIRTSIVIVALAASLTGCTSSATVDTPTPAERVCLRAREINSFSALDDHHVVVKLKPRERYLLTLEQSCSGLTFSRMIAVADRSTWVCNDRTSWLTFDHAGYGTRRCRIMDIEPVESENEAKAIVESRTTD